MQKITKLPEHVAIIMDGNGRWAKAQNHTRSYGHKAGVIAAEKVINLCLSNSISILSLFAFGQENFQRPAKEVRNIFRLFLLALNRRSAELIAKGVKINIIGDYQNLPDRLLADIEKFQNESSHNTKLTLNIAFNYSGRWDILQAVKSTVINQKHKINLNTDFANLEHYFVNNLAFFKQKDPDLLIRTGNVTRISNFMLWQLAYTELYFSKKLWPDFGEEDFNAVLVDYSNRERRFGKV